MKNDIILNKISIIERCLHRIREVYDDQPASLNDFTKQDSIILNFQRACEASIDIAMHIVAEKKLGLPQNRRDAFTFLEKEEVISSPLSQKMKAMIAFQKTAVHDYEVNVVILQHVLEDRLVDFMEYTKAILAY
ncbi:type VII toxin-antitoxin system HepT family RNase toxin [Jeotgalibacillus campisalis]|uniref:DUF86 domain-containing protein n=1 Tax=Jeotgalibacillus campisalis TaxID=220754 RepID=A0A0C2QYS2_9BACL|nr:DUF86 domain-containing protein [Jeotgalibacillus campisalis]KIL43190.1 hypothetical protein KR50_35930 [Jeotgalibacillus campisalis]